MSNKTYAGLRQPKLVDQRPRIDYEVIRSTDSEEGRIRLIGDGTYRVWTDDNFKNMYVEECYFQRISNTFLENTKEIVSFEFVKTPSLSNLFSLEFLGVYQLVFAGLNTTNTNWYTNIDSYTGFLGERTGEPISLLWRAEFVQSGNLDVIVTISNGVAYISTWGGQQ